jgi:hypothetical protein
MRSAEYLRDQRNGFLAGLPAPDFPGGEGEAKMTGRGTPKDALSQEGLRALGLLPFETSSVLSPTEVEIVSKANEILA